MFSLLSYMFVGCVFEGMRMISFCCVMVVMIIIIFFVCCFFCLRFLRVFGGV